jgi:hypothetical protein
MTTAVMAYLAPGLLLLLALSCLAEFRAVSQNFRTVVVIGSWLFIVAAWPAFVALIVYRMSRC